jgi:hypothetical protein
MVQVYWELPDELMQDGRPFVVSRRYTFSAGENSNFRKHLEAWRGKKFTAEDLKTFEVDKLLKKPCVLTLATEDKNGKTNQNVIAISPPMKGSKIPTNTVNEAFCFALTDGMFAPSLMEKLSEKMQETIKKSPEYQALSKGQSPSSSKSQSEIEFDDEIPF